MLMISIIDVILILLIHFVADFLCQTRKMATNKSKSIPWLTFHVFVYTIVTTIGWEYLLNLKFIVVPTVIIITFITHWVTDFFTSKLTTYFYKKERYFEFFGVIGLDQFIKRSVKPIHRFSVDEM